MRQKQKGIALLTILLMVALATILASTIIKRQAYTAENTGYLMRQNQSLLYAKSAESFFAELLKDDLDHAAEVDHLQESWAQPMPALAIEGGMISGLLVDEAGKFNLNSLTKADGSVNENAKLWFEQLLVRLELPAQLSEAVIDWQDPNDELTGAMGAESSDYARTAQAYLTPNAPFHHAEQLKLVRGFEQDYVRILPYVSALVHHDTQVNINTAPAFLLASLDSQLDQAEIEQLFQRRRANAEIFNQVDELWQLAPFSQIPIEKRQFLNNLLSVKSNYFRAQIEIIFDDRKRQFSSHLIRKDKTVYVGYRSLAPFVLDFPDYHQQQN